MSSPVSGGCLIPEDFLYEEIFLENMSTDF